MSDFSNTTVFISPTAMEMSSLQKCQTTLWGILFPLYSAKLYSLVHVNCVRSAVYHKPLEVWLFEHEVKEISIIYILIAPPQNSTKQGFFISLLVLFYLVNHEPTWNI